MTSTELARAVVWALVEAGVREVVVAPGSRNAPLTFAAYDAAAAGLLRLHTRIDERSAGFLALGLTKVGSRAAVICTSGTAVANLHPAMLEAAHAGVRLVAVTADRPARLRGTGANQTTDQVGLFGPLVPYVDLGEDDAGVVPTALGLGRGPLHLNVRLDDPLVPSEPWQVPRPSSRHGAAARLARLDHRSGRRPEDGRGRGGRRGAAGAGAGGAGTVAAARRTHEREPDRRERLAYLPPAARRSADRRGRAGGRVRPPHAVRPVQRLMQRDDVEVLSVPPRGAWTERPFPVARHLDPRPGVEAPDESDWFDRWLAEDRRVGDALDALLRDEGDLTPYEVAGAVARALPAGGLLVVGASNPVRDLDLMVPRYEVGGRRKTIANRGLSGIDGTVSTAIGAALGRDSTRSFALMGDVTFLHDANGLVHDVHDPEPDLTIVVVNDDGGSIFATLEQGAPEHADRFDRLFGTPHGVDLASLCAATRTPHWRVESLAELEQALASPNGGVEVVEVRVRRDNRRELDERIRRLAQQ